MINIFLYVLFVCGIYVIGGAFNALVKINIRNKYFESVGDFIVGVCIVSLIGYILWITKQYNSFQFIFVLLFLISFFYLNLQIFQKKLFYSIGTILGGVLLTPFAIGNNFDLLWDAKASWFLKSKQFFIYNDFPGELFINPITENIAKDYPTWTSHFYASMARFVGEWSEMNIKALQSTVVIMALVITVLIIYEIILSTRKLNQNNTILLSLVFTGFLYGNNYFYLYIQSGYIDFTILLHWLVVVSGIILANLYKEKNYLLLAGLVAFASLLVKNEGMSIVLFFIMNVVFIYKKTVFQQLKSILPFVVFIGLAFLSWQIIKNQYNFKSPLIDKGFGIKSTIYFIFREFSIFGMYVWEIVRNFSNWSLSYFIGISSFLAIILEGINGYIRKDYNFRVIFALSFMVALLLYFIPYGIADLGIGFYFESTRDRLMLQLIPTSFIIALFLAKSNFFIEQKLQYKNKRH